MDHRAVRRAHRQVGLTDSALHHHCLGMAEGTETIDAMIGPHARVTDPAKGQCLEQHMAHHVVDHHAA